MLSYEVFENIQKEVDELKNRITALFTDEIRNSRGYARMFPRVPSAMNDKEKELVDCIESFERLCMKISLYHYEPNSSKCANDFIVDLKNLLSQIEGLIGEIDWTK